nr:MAG TPA: hypothetical protein [Caudoviricetes sp.]DAO81929.1 MAG TPA: hypothetical protein [Caudoviricetes sp.]
MLLAHVSPPLFFYRVKELVNYFIKYLTTFTLMCKMKA